MSKVGRVLCSLTRYSLYRGIVTDGKTTSLRLNNTKTLSLTSEGWAKSKKPTTDYEDDEEVVSQPIKFSTSKASQKNWSVRRSLGSNYQRPLWKVLPISVIGMGFLLWCFFRGQTDIDEKLERDLYEHLPGLLSDQEEVEEKVESKSS